MSPALLPPLLALTVTSLALGIFQRLSLGPLDHPNHRSLHSRPTPRVGGLGMAMGIVIALGYVRLGDWHNVLVIAFGLCAVSLLDDYLQIPALLRFLAHAAAAALFLYASPWAGWPWAALLAVGLGLVWFTNLYNFMDGADGLAGGMALFGFGAYALAALWQGQPVLFLICVVLVASALGFLFFNFPPAHLFLGDAGSIPLGFLAGALGFAGWQDHVWPAWFPLLVFSPFVVDASVTLLRRILHGQKPWQAHRSHYYQRLVRLGASHKRLALAEYALMLGLAASALTVLRFAPYLASILLVAWGVFYVWALRAIDRHWHQVHGDEL